MVSTPWALESAATYDKEKQVELADVKATKLKEGQKAEAEGQKAEIVEKIAVAEEIVEKIVENLKQPKYITRASSVRRACCASSVRVERVSRGGFTERERERESFETAYQTC